MTRLQDRADKAKGEIGQRLDDPLDQVDLEGLAARWVTGRATFRLPGMAPIAQDPGLPGRIRGAFGARLKDSASAQAVADQPCPWDPPCTFDALWRKQGRMNAGFDHASPWVLAVDPHNGALDVSLTLFGFANDWMPAALEAMTAALLHDVDWQCQSGLFLPQPQVTHRHVVEVEGLTLPPPATDARLSFLSPLALSNADPRERPASLLVGLARRVEALARWHDVSLSEKLDMKALAREARGLTFAFEDVAKIEWTRGSRRQDRSIPMHGLMGDLAIATPEGQGAPEWLAPLLAFGALCHIGADVAFGCGRYELTFAA